MKNSYNGHYAPVTTFWQKKLKYFTKISGFGYIKLVLLLHKLPYIPQTFPSRFIERYPTPHVQFKAQKVILWYFILRLQSSWLNTSVQKIWNKTPTTWLVSKHLHWS